MEKITVLKVKTHVKEFEVDSNFEPSLKGIQEFLDGYMEVVRISDTIILIVNEEGKLRRMVVNFLLLSRDNLILDHIAGNAFFASYDGDGEIKSLSADQINFIKESFIDRVHLQLV